MNKARRDKINQINIIRKEIESLCERMDNLTDELREMKGDDNGMVFTDKPYFETRWAFSNEPHNQVVMIFGEN